MKAAIYTHYGSPDVLQITEIEKPVPQAHDVLIKVATTTVSAVDSNFRRGEGLSVRLATGLTGPRNRILGGLLAGEVEAVGAGVTLFKPGDRVFGAANTGIGTYAEYVCLPENAIMTTLPNGISFEEAVGIPEALTALYFLKELAKIEKGQTVLINGASGAVGTYAIQLARYFGADVTGVCSTANVNLVTSLGAHQVIDYTREDFTHNGKRYDVIFDVVGKSSFSRCKSALTPQGMYLTTVMTLAIFPQMLWTSRGSGQKAVLGLAGLNQKVENLLFLKSLVEEGALKTVIDRHYPLEQIAEAHRYVDTGRKKGHVVITMAPSH